MIVSADQVADRLIRHEPVYLINDHDGTQLAERRFDDDNEIGTLNSHTGVSNALAEDIPNAFGKLLRVNWRTVIRRQFLSRGGREYLHRGICLDRAHLE